MDILVIVVVFFLSAVPVAVNPTWIMKALYCLVPFFIGLLVIIEGVTYNGSAHIAAGTNMVGITVFVMMTLGSLVTAYGTSIGKDVQSK